MVDWGIESNDIFVLVTAGKKANVCSLCYGYDHQSAFCYLATENGVASAKQSSLALTGILDLVHGLIAITCMYAGNVSHPITGVLMANAHGGLRRMTQKTNYADT